MYYNGSQRTEVAVKVDKKNNNVPKTKERALLTTQQINTLINTLSSGMNGKHPVRCLHYLNNCRPKVSSIFELPKLPSKMSVDEIVEFYNSEEETYGYIGLEYDDGSCHLFNYLNRESEYYLDLEK